MDEAQITNTLNHLINLSKQLKPSDVVTTKGTVARQLEDKIFQNLPKNRQMVVFLARLVEAALYHPAALSKPSKTPSMKELAEKAFLRSSGFSLKTPEEYAEYLSQFLDQETPQQTTPLLLLPTSTPPKTPTTRKQNSKLSLKAQIIITVIGDASMRPLDIFKGLEKYSQMLKEQKKVPFNNINATMMFKSLTSKGVLIKPSKGIYRVAPNYKQFKL